ncbi:TIGR03790 family protein [Deefgea sp. CFH1-16]|uniref:TIGR03790 family protein n=1 Tax=Deefgea sp. CFH1-16 TaxID=2675457 RepID=UPI0015F74196|nr:TIGR03790 family protein [Deefgea sp. CFH1-16]MBM5573611.1 TIGR03790 family protein [Deefgea sp. CFH1-16]
MFPPSQIIKKPAIKIENIKANTLKDKSDILIYQTGLANVADLATLRFVPGALADHLTSYGGMLTDSGQMSSMKWLESGATASYGTVSEPYSYPQKFPHPQVLLGHYLFGATAVEAYWKSVAWPAQGVFIGDPLAAPYRSLSPFK